MKPFFDSDASLALLRGEIKSWEKTPFIVGLGRKGRGTDCVHFVHAVLVACGVMAPITFPKYSTRGRSDEVFRLLVDTLRGTGAFEEVPVGDTPPEILPGDVLVYSLGRQSHHAGIAWDDRTFYHAAEPFGVCLGAIRDTVFLKNLRAIFRPQGAALDPLVKTDAPQGRALTNGEGDRASEMVATGKKLSKRRRKAERRWNAGEMEI